jgi:hypothetical protein
MIRIYETDQCPRCRALWTELEKLLPYPQAELIEFVRLDTPEGLAEARINGAFGLEAPMLQIDSVVIMPASIFKGDVLQLDELKKLLSMVDNAR